MMRITFLLSGLLAAIPSMPLAADDTGVRKDPLTAIRRFAYQLQKLDVKVAAASDAEMIVVEPNDDTRPLTRDDVALLRKKPDGSPRVVLAYLSIGEAEDYRPYWKKEWRAAPPPWLDKENPDWKGNYKVRYWDPAWQSLIRGQAECPLDRIVAAGFDGVYLDIVDGFEYWEEKGVKDARTKMVAWVRSLAAHARKIRPGFLVVPQNGEALAREEGYLAFVDALGREDVFFNGDKPQPAADSRDVAADAKRFRDAGKPVFLIEYCQKDSNREAVLAKSRALGWVPLLTVRPLDKLMVTPAK